MECSKHTTCRGWSLHRIIWTILTYSLCIIIFLAYSTNTIHKNKAFGTSFKEDASRKISSYLVTSWFSWRLQLCETRMHSSRYVPSAAVAIGGGGGGSAQWGCQLRVICLGQGVCQGGCIPAFNGADTPRLWIEFLTHTCENITFPQLLLRTVIISSSCDWLLLKWWVLYYLGS